MIDLERVPAHRKTDLRRMLSCYLVELFQFLDNDPELDDDGEVTYRWFNFYWTMEEGERIPFGFWRGDNLIGFCLLRDAGTYWQIAEFYVSPEFRRQSVGTEAVAAIKSFCMTSGKHNLVEANTLKRNSRAIAFWKRQGFETITETDDQYINVYSLDRRFSVQALGLA